MGAWVQTFHLRRTYSHSDGRTIRIYEDTRAHEWHVRLDAASGLRKWRWVVDSERKARDIWREIVGLDEEWIDTSWHAPLT